MLTGAESAQLLGPAGERLAALGITVEWPAELLTPGTVAAHISVAPRSATGSGTFSLADAADLTWQLDLNGEPLTEQETRAAADAVAGVLQLRGRWVVLDAETQQRARDPRAGRLCGAQALAAALTGQVTVGGRDIACCATEALADLVAVLRGAGSGPHDVVLPGGLETTLRDYQRRGVQWLVRMTSAGFGALLADDMGLGKTLTVIAYRLVRESTAPSLVVCPASLLGNWEREFARFAPDVAVRRYHGAGRSLGGLTPGEVVVTTYGMLLRDAGMLADVPWDLVVADEAQAGQEPPLAGLPRPAAAPPGSARRGHRHPDRELPVGAVVDPGLDEPRAVRLPRRVSGTDRARRRTGGDRSQRRS